MTVMNIRPILSVCKADTSYTYLLLNPISSPISDLKKKITLNRITNFPPKHPVTKQKSVYLNLILSKAQTLHSSLVVGCLGDYST